MLILHGVRDEFPNTTVHKISGVVSEHVDHILRGADYCAQLLLGYRGLYCAGEFLVHYFFDLVSFEHL